MADVINIATFEFDTDRLQANLDKLQNGYFKLKQEAQGYSNLAKEQQKAINELVKANLALANAGEESSDAFKENEAAISDLNAALIQNQKNQQNVGTQLGRVRSELSQTQKQLQSYMNSQGEQTTLIEAGTAALQREIKNKNDAKAANIELNRVSNQLNPNIKEEAELLKLVNAQLDKNTAYIKENSSETAQQKMNVGNYAESIKAAIGDLGGFNGALGNAQEALGKVSPLFASLKSEASAAFQQLRGGTVATEGMTAAQIASATATNVVSGALKLFRIALISTGIGAIVVLLGSLVSYLTTTQAGIDKLTAVTRPLQAIFSALGALLNNLGAALVETFSNPKKAITDLANFVKQNLINRFTAFGEILEGIINLDFKQITDGVLQAGTGVEGLTGKIADAASGTAKFLSDAAAKGAEIDRLTKEQTKAQLAYNAAQIAYNDAVDEQLLITKDTSKSFAERGAAAQEIIRLADENSKKEQEILQLELRRLKIQQELTGLANLTNEDKQEEIDLLEKIDAAEDRALNARLENSRVLAGLEKERRDQAVKAAEEARKLADDRAANGIKQMEAELDFYIQSQGIRKKGMQDQLDLDRQTMKQSLAIAESEYKNQVRIADRDIKNKKDRDQAKLLLETEYQTQQLAIQSEFMAKQVEATVANADIELEIFMLNNQTKIEQGQFLSDTLYQQEIDRINRITEAEQANATLRYEQGLLSLQEYQLAIAELDQADFEKRKELELQRKEEQKAVEEEERSLEIIAAGEAYQYDLAANLANFDAETKALREAAIKRGVSEEAFDKARAEQKKQIERDVNNNRLELASSTFGALASIAGKESAAGKAFAVAQTTIDTYKSATSAYASLSGIPIIGPVLGGIAAAAAVVAGLANVKKILSTKDPKVDTNVQKPSYAQGGLIRGLGTSLSDSIDANLSNGESVMTARATAMFPNTLSTINQLGGGVGFDGQFASTLTQNQISERTDNSQMAEMIAEAVAVGAERGTQSGAERGMTNLSDNAEIMRNAKF